MTVFLCEDTVNGIFTGIYDAWASRLGHGNVRLELEDCSVPELFTDYIDSIPDEEKSRKVADTIRRRMGFDAYEMIYQSALSNHEKKADSIYRLLVRGLSGRISDREAAKMIHDLTDPDTLRVFELSRKVSREAHRYMGFVRFRELEDGILFSEIEAESQVLPLLADHFSNRFPNENFLIYDRHFRTGLVHRKNVPPVILTEVEPEQISFLSNRRNSGQEEEIQRLWNGFFNSVAIRERRNLHLQSHLLPHKFRKYMTEVS